MIRVNKYPKWYRAVGLIPRDYDRRDQWLAIPSTGANSLDGPHRLGFVMGEPIEGGNFRDSLFLPLQQALGLSCRDFLVSNMAQQNLEFGAALPGDDLVRHIAVAFYLVHLYSQRARSLVDSNSFYWVTPEEIAAGQTRDGATIDPVLSFLAAQTRLF